MLKMVSTLARTLRTAIGSRQDLLLENLALRHQLAVLTRAHRRPRFRPADRLLWTWLRRLWDSWRESLVLVHPSTVVRWHREGFRRYWARKSRRRSGRPRVDPESYDSSVAWRLRIRSGERPGSMASLKLGIEISERTVSRWIPRQRKPPSQTWRTFLDNHLRELVSIDFFTVPTARFQVLFCFLVLSHDRRRVLHFNVTRHPTAEWTARQVVQTFPWETAPRYLLRNRDGVYGAHFRRRVAGLGLTEVLIAPRSPWQNPYVERLIGSIRRECLDHVVVLNERHLRRIVAGYLVYYHRARTHLSLGKDAPETRPAQPPTCGEIVELPEVGGLHHRYERRAT